MPSEQVYRTPISIHGECHLDTRLPTTCLEVRGYATNDESMALVQQSIELAISPSDNVDEVSIERSEDAGNAGDGQVVDLTALESRNLTLADTSPPGNVHLPPAESVSEGSGDPAEAEVAHASQRADNGDRIGLIARPYSRRAWSGRPPKVAEAGDADRR